MRKADAILNELYRMCENELAEMLRSTCRNTALLAKVHVVEDRS